MSMQVQTPDAHRTTAESVDVFQPFMGLSPDEFRELACKILIGVPHRPSEGINKGLFKNAGVWALLGTPVANISDEFEGFIELTRAGMVRAFLDYCADHPECEYFVMIDNDESVDWDAPYRLAQWGKDIVSGIVCSFSLKKGGVFACVTAKDKNGIARFPTVKRTKLLPSSGLKPIESAGTGLLCVHKRVFEKMLEEDDPPFMIPEDVRLHCCATGTLKLGEDMAFSQRAKQHGFEMFVDFSVRAVHYKTLEISWPQEFIKSDIDVRDWQVSDGDYIHL